MTSHTPLAGDDLVARLRERIRETDRQADADVMAEAIEALTSQQHTEPVAGEVEVVAWLRMNEAGTQSTGVTDVKRFGDDWSKSGDHVEPLVTKSSYDALAAAKDRLEKINADHCRTINTYVIDNARLADRAEAAERQRDALREVVERQRKALGQISSMHMATVGGTHQRATFDLNRARDIARAALKDEGSAT